MAAAARPLRQGRVPILREIIGNSLDRLSPKAVAEAALAGEEECRAIYRQVGRVLGLGISIAEHLHELKILRAELDEPGVMGAAVWAAEQWASMYPKHQS